MLDSLSEVAAGSGGGGGVDRRLAALASIGLHGVLLARLHVRRGSIGAAFLVLFWLKVFGRAWRLTRLNQAFGGLPFCLGFCALGFGFCPRTLHAVTLKGYLSHPRVPCVWAHPATALSFLPFALCQSEQNWTPLDRRSCHAAHPPPKSHRPDGHNTSRQHPNLCRVPGTRDTEP